MSPLIYTSSLIDTPMEALKEINDIIQNFIWEGQNITKYPNKKR